MHGARPRIDADGVYEAVVADDPDLVHGAVTLLNGLGAHDPARITALRAHDRFGQRQLASVRELRDGGIRQSFARGERRSLLGAATRTLKSLCCSRASHAERHGRERGQERATQC